jgi:hypothetical protein
MSSEQTTTLHRHKPQNVNIVHKKNMSLMNKVGLKITLAVGTMTCAIIFAGIALISLPSVIQQTFAGGHFQPILIIAWVAQTFLQLVLLSIIMVGQNVQSEHAVLRADEEYKTTLTSYGDIENILQHLDMQEKELLKQTKMLEQILAK